MADMDALRERIAAAIGDTIDRCARCKVCEVQIDAVMAVLQEAGLFPEGTVTQWGLRLTGESAEPTFYAYQSEENARGDVRKFQGVFDTVVVWRQVGPWTVAAGTCRHCGATIVPCPCPPEVPVCKGWKHTEFIESMLVGAHYCEGRSVNRSAEPAEGGDDG